MKNPALENLHNDDSMHWLFGQELYCDYARYRNLALLHENTQRVNLHCNTIDMVYP
jgi:hypothetical protein